MIPASSAPSGCFDTFEDSVISCFCVVAAISALCLLFSFEFGIAFFELDCFTRSRFVVTLALCVLLSLVL